MITSFTDKKGLSNFKKFSESLIPASGSKDVTEIRRKRRKLSFHPHIFYKRVHTSALMVC